MLAVIRRRDVLPRRHTRRLGVDTRLARIKTRYYGQQCVKINRLRDNRCNGNHGSTLWVFSNGRKNNDWNVGQRRIALKMR
jgi:hypothetical protein